MMRVHKMIITYIIKTRSGEFYCGKTSDIDKRIKEHKKEKKPHWFSYKDRDNFFMPVTIRGDYENQIKRAGVKFVYDILTAPAS